MVPTSEVRMFPNLVSETSLVTDTIIILIEV